MKHETHQPHQSALDRLRHSKTARVTAFILGFGVAAAGCSSASTSPGKAPSGGSTVPVAVGTRTPGTSPSAPETGSATPKTDWCSAASAIINKAFQVTPGSDPCELMPNPSVSSPFIEWTLPDGALIQADESPLPFSQLAKGSQVTTVGGVKVILIPQEAEMYVDMGNNQTTGMLQIESGPGGSIPYGASQSLLQAAGVFQVFGEINPYAATQ